jgi:hypothetical protein
MKITVIDTNSQFTAVFSGLAPENIDVVFGSVQLIKPEYGVAYVSPANSFLFMSYKQIFDNFYFMTCL